MVQWRIRTWQRIDLLDHGKLERLACTNDDLHSSEELFVVSFGGVIDLFFGGHVDEAAAGVGEDSDRLRREKRSQLVRKDDPPVQSQRGTYRYITFRKKVPKLLFRRSRRQVSNPVPGNTSALRSHLRTDSKRLTKARACCHGLARRTSLSSKQSSSWVPQAPKAVVQDGIVRSRQRESTVG